MDIIDNQTVVVYNTDELRDAVSTDNGISYVFLGADIVLAYGITIYAGKESLIFDGLYPQDGTGIIRSFTDMQSSSATNTLGVRSPSSINVTIQNMNMVGYNYYGIPYFSGGTGQNGVILTYRNVTYAGPQITHNPNGLTRFFDCDITIRQGTTEPQEVAETNRVEFGGTVHINKTNTIHSVFYFRGTSDTAYFKVFSEALVTVNTQNYFMFTMAGAVQFIIEPNATLIVNTRTGFSESSVHLAASFLVDTNAVFRYIQAENNGTQASLYMNGAFTVNQGANVYMQADVGSTGPLIRFTTNAGRVAINNPKSFVLYRRGSPALTFAIQIPYSFSGGQLNYWRTSASFPQAGTFLDIPFRKWHKDKYVTFTWNGTVSSAQTTISEYDFTQEELDLLPPLEDLQIQSAHVLSIGDLPLRVNPVIEYQTSITGQTEPNANMVAEYSAGGTGYSVADTNGRFSIEMPFPVPFDIYVTISTNTPFLITTVTEVSHKAGDLILQHAPQLITFILSPVSIEPLLLAREDPDATVEVYDDRTESTPWELSASIDGPLTTDSGRTLPDAVVFVDDDGLTPLSNVPLPVYLGEPNEGEAKTTECSWDEDKGVLLHVREPIFNSERYTAHVSWDLRPIDD